MDEFTLTPQQICFFDTFGFIKFPGLFNDRIDDIIEAFEDVWSQNDQRGFNGKVHMQDRTKRSTIVPFADQNEYLCTLLDDRRGIAIASALCGDDFNYIGGDGNLMSTDGNWHSDGYIPDRIRMIKLGFYLDPLTRYTGALRVIPGSQHCGDKFGDALHDGTALDISHPENYPKWDITPDEIPCQVIENTPGDLIVFNVNVKHVSLYGSTRRRMFVLGITARFPDDRIEELQEMLAFDGRFMKDRAIGEKMIATAGPERMKHLQQVLDNDFKRKAVADEHRKKLTEVRASTAGGRLE